MVEWWGDNGFPVYISVAAYLGTIKKRGSSGKTSKPTTVRKADVGNLEDLAKAFSSSGGHF